MQILPKQLKNYLDLASSKRFSEAKFCEDNLMFFTSASKAEYKSLKSWQ